MYLCLCITFHYITYVHKSNHNHSSALMTSARKGNTWVPLIDVPLSANLRRRFRSITQSDSANNNRRARSFLPRPNVIFPHFYNHSLLPPHTVTHTLSSLYYTAITPIPRGSIFHFPSFRSKMSLALKAHLLTPSPISTALRNMSCLMRCMILVKVCVRLNPSCVF